MGRQREDRLPVGISSDSFRKAHFIFTDFYNFLSFQNKFTYLRVDAYLQESRSSRQGTGDFMKSQNRCACLHAHTARWHGHFIGPQYAHFCINIFLSVSLSCMLECHRARLASQQLSSWTVRLGSWNLFCVQITEFLTVISCVGFCLAVTRMFLLEWPETSLWPYKYGHLTLFSFENVVFVAQVTSISSGTWHQAPNNDGGSGSQYLEYSRSGRQAKNGNCNIKSWPNSSRNLTSHWAVLICEGWIVLAVFWGKTVSLIATSKPFPFGWYGVFVVINRKKLAAGRIQNKG